MLFIVNVMPKKITQEEFINRAKLIHGDKYDYSEVNYINSSTKVKIICPIHGGFEQIPNNHLRGVGCFRCKYEDAKSLVYGVGINDYPYSVFISKKHIKSYACWRSMLSRCYNVSYQKKQPTYIDCFVCDEWLVFSNFKNWFDKNYIEGFHLDKDILIQGNKEYSPNTCCFVPQHINNLLTDHHSARGEYKIGVRYSKKLNKFLARYCCNGESIHIGCYSTEEEAHEAYKQAKYAEIKRVATEALENGYIDKKVYVALLSYKISEY